MIEQMEQTNRGQFNVEGSLQVCTGDATTGAEGKPMVSWSALLDEAVKKPGFIHEAYSWFHNFSLGNQLLALFQCIMRGIQPGPFGHFPEVERAWPSREEGREGADAMYASDLQAHQDGEERRRHRPGRGIFLYPLHLQGSLVRSVAD